MSRIFRRFVSPALVLLFLSPVVGELLSGSAPPAEFFNPIGLIPLVILYGGGALLCRALMYRWEKGWLTLLVLGAAYGIAEEGLMCKSFFDPAWGDLGILGSYGRWGGVNWVWSVELTIYHALFSIAIPVLLVGLIFPRSRTRPWISWRAFKWLFALWLANGIWIFLFVSPYRPPLAHYVLAVVVTVALVLLSRHLPAPPLVPQRARLCAPFWYRLVGFLATCALFLFVWGFPESGAPPLVTVLSIVGLCLAVGWTILGLLGGGILWSEKHQLALASGALGFFILLAPLQELDRTRADNTAGMSLVGLFMLVFLIWVGRRLKEFVEGGLSSVPTRPSA